MDGCHFCTTWNGISFLEKAVKSEKVLPNPAFLVTKFEALFADISVALLTVLNAVRIQRMKL